MNRCLYCYKPLKEGQTDFHPACARKLFGVKEAPSLPYRRSQIADLAKRVVRAQTTLTGVQAKLSLDVNPGGRNEPDRFTIVGLWGRYILKPQTDAYRALPELEDLTMHMAEAAKIAVVPHSLIRFADGELCYITRRIDRERNGMKIAMEDMCQLSERLTEYKYKGSYEQIAKQMDVIMREQDERAEERYRRLDTVIREMQQTRREIAAAETTEKKKKHFFGKKNK